MNPNETFNSKRNKGENMRPALIGAWSVEQTLCECSSVNNPHIENVYRVKCIALFTLVWEVLSRYMYTSIGSMYTNTIEEVLTDENTTTP